jgi:hypothetical protein
VERQGADLPNRLCGQSCFDAFVERHFVGQGIGGSHEAVQLLLQIGDRSSVLGAGNQVRRFVGVALQVVELGQVAIGRTVAVGIVDVFVAVGADAPDVRRVGELLLVVVFVVPARAPAGGVTLSQLLPRGPVRLRRRRQSADVEDRRGEVEGEDLVVDNAPRARDYATESRATLRAG